MGVRHAWIGVLFTAAIASSAGGGAVAAPAISAPAIERVPFKAAPRQVQRDLARVLASCGVPARDVKAKARFDVGPLGGPGRRDYFFEAPPGAGDSRVSICT